MKQTQSIWLAGVFTVLGLVILLWLGFWQVDRLAWKTALLERIDTNLAAQPVLLPSGIDILEWEYRKACVAGAFLHDKEMHLFSTRLTGQPGYHIYTPFEIEGGGVIIINRGWVPDIYKAPSARLEGQVPGIVEVCGILRASRQQGRLVPDNNPDENGWYTANATEMGEAANLANVLPFLLDADNAANPGGYPIGGQTRIDIPNNHLGYAITWFGLAAALAGVFTAFVISQRRKPVK